MACETNVGRLRESVLKALRRYGHATNALRECQSDSPDLEKKCSEWETARGSMEDLISNRSPKRLRDALRGGSDEIRDAWVLKFRSRNPEEFSLWVPPMEFVDNETDKGDAITHRVRVCRHVSHYLKIHEWQPEWPDVESATGKAETVFDELTHLGIDDLTPTVDEVKKIVIELITSAESGLRRQADSSSGVSRKLLVAHAPFAPPRGFPVGSLKDRVFEIEPAADQGAIDAACDELERDGVIQQEKSEFSNILTKERIKEKRWCLAKPASTTAPTDTPERSDTHVPAAFSADKPQSESGLEKLATIPALPPEKVGWVSQVVAARSLIEETRNSKEDTKAGSRKVGALKKARTRGIHDKGATAGIDKDGHIWRQDPDDKKTVWYLESTVDKKNKR
ncbi:MAG: hypothetical protein IH987_02040 [Planctomycetes bacterium]|nr:hypothetical protein [Planctomycetota bacterium]